MKVLAHPDPLVLERELCERVGAAATSAGLARVTVLVPTTRLAAHVERRLAERRAAWLGVEALHFQALAWRIEARQASSAPLRLASPRLLEALLRRVLAGLPRNRWRAYVERRPGALPRLLEVLSDLREADLRPALVDEVCRDRDVGERDLAAVYRAYVRELERRAEAGWTDAAGLARRAAAGARAWAREQRAVLVHGAYELIGVHLDLLREIDRGTELTVLLPMRPGAAVSIYAERFAREFLLAAGATAEVLPDGDPARAARLSALFDDEAVPPAAPAGQFAFRHTRGTEAEVREAVRSATAAIRDGCPPAEIAIVARSLEPYAAALEEVLASEPLPWSSSLGGPLRRQPLVHDLLLLLRVVTSYPRRATAELLRSPRLRWRAVLGGDEPPPGDLADAWSRSAGIVGGLEEWRAFLTGWAGAAHRDDESEAERAKRLALAQRIVNALTALDERVAPAARSWTEHAARFEQLLEEVLVLPEEEPGAGAAEALRALFDEMRGLDTLVPETGPIAFEEARRWLEQAVNGATLAVRGTDGGGVRILGATELRGLTFRRVLWIGANTGLWPRQAREDPILRDELRQELAARSRRPLAPRSGSIDEEHLLLALLAGSAAERLEVSWQRADEAGRARTPSLALREVARMWRGAPQLEPLFDAAVHVPSHPAHALEHRLDVWGLVSPAERLLLAALHCPPQDVALAELGRRHAELAPGLALLCETQAFTGTPGRFDARIGARPLPERISVTALETLGSCPLQYFFQYVLRVRRLDPESRASEQSGRDVGAELHGVLERLYATLEREGIFAGGVDPEAAVERAFGWLEAERASLLGDAGRRLAARLPVLWEQTSARWLERCRSFVEWDLRHLLENGLRPERREVDCEETLDFGDGARVTVRARFDRELLGGERRIVSDYKISRNVARRVELANMLKASTLQVPLYQRLAGAGSRVEILGLHPELEPGSDSRKAFEDFPEAPQRASFDDTMRALLGLLEAGAFPFHEEEFPCSWCAYRQSCRRHDPPTQDREAAAADSARFHRAKKKSTRNLDGKA